MSIIAIGIILNAQFDGSLSFTEISIDDNELMKLLIALKELGTKFIIHDGTILLIKRSTVTTERTTNPIIQPHINKSLNMIIQHNKK